jgi:hypothetical protein
VAEDWSIEGPYLKNCNCDPGCPCDFNADPTHGFCEGMTGMKIESGHYGDVSLDGLHWAALYHWPGRIDEGDGHIQPILDEAADDSQREALGTILSGQAGGTFFEIVDAMTPHKKDPIFAPFEWTYDLDERTATVKAGDAMETETETLRGIDPPDPYRVLVHIPGGFEYVNEADESDIALATYVRTNAAIELQLERSHSSICRVRYSPDR